jgi:hypothetical protein
MERDTDKRRMAQPANDAGRSREREKQDAMLESAAYEESWLSRLWRSMRERRAKPPPKDPQPPNRRAS